MLKKRQMEKGVGKEGASAAVGMGRYIGAHEEETQATGMGWGQRPSQGWEGVEVVSEGCKKTAGHGYCRWRGRAAAAGGLVARQSMVSWSHLSL